MYYINVCVKFVDFSQQREKEKAYPYANIIVKKVHWLEHTRYTFLNNSKTLNFSDVIKREMPFKYLHTRAICTYSLCAKKTI